VGKLKGFSYIPIVKKRRTGGKSARRQTELTTKNFRNKLDLSSQVALGKMLLSKEEKLTVRGKAATG